ncbi:MFS transporter [Actinomycetaceae bacterium TAE3-ERU4]|nr:MFS transporter [Actinomycetaceae bacterium TAE3-ERU4]
MSMSKVHGRAETEEVLSPPRLETFPTAVMLTISCATFLVITAEMLPAGVLRLISADLGVTKSQAGYLMSGYAFTVVATCVPLTHLTRFVDRTRLLRIVVACYVVGALLNAIAPTYSLVMATRIFTGIFHGLFWSVISAYPAYLVTPRLIPKAVTYSSVGGSAAFIAGVPLATYMGQVLGWRVSQGLIGLLLLALLLVMYRKLPLVGVSAPKPTTKLSREEKKQQRKLERVSRQTALERSGRRPLILIPRTSLAAALGLCLTVALYVIGQYTAYSYISEIITAQMGIDSKYISLVLFGSGLVGFIGSVLSGRVFERFGNRALVAMTFTVALALSLLALVGTVTWVGIILVLLWSLAGAFVPSFFVMRMLVVTPSKVRDVIGAVYNASFNLGIGGGALIGGLLLAAFDIERVIISASVLAWVASLVTLLLGILVVRSERFLATE